MAIAWTDELSIGLSQVDAQHKGIIDTLAQMCETATETNDWNTTLELAGEVIDLFCIHFTSEEHLMRSIRYPEVDSHALAHSAFFDDFTRLVYRIEKHDGGVVGDLVTCVRRWAFDHVDNMDRKIARYIEQIG